MSWQRSCNKLPEHKEEFPPGKPSEDNAPQDIAPQDPDPTTFRQGPSPARGTGARAAGAAPSEVRECGI